MLSALFCQIPPPERSARYDGGKRIHQQIFHCVLQRRPAQKWLKIRIGKLLHVHVQNAVHHIFIPFPQRAKRQGKAYRKSKKRRVSKLQVFPFRIFLRHKKAQIAKHHTGEKVQEYIPQRQKIIKREDFSQKNRAE